MRSRWLLLLAIAACAEPAAEPLPTMPRRPAPPQVAPAPRCSNQAIEAGWFQGQLWLCAPGREAAWDCANTDDSTERVAVASLLWGRASGRAEISRDTDAEWDDAGAVTLRDRATGDAVQTARIRLGPREVELSLVEGPPVMLRGWNVGGCDLLLHFGGR